MTVEEYVNRFDDLYQYISDLFPTKVLKIARFKQGLSMAIRSRISMFSFITTYRGWVDAAREAEAIIKEMRE